MADIDKITGEILEEARKTAEKKTEAARAEASDVIMHAGEECKRLENDFALKVKAAEKSAADRASSSAQLKKRQAVLNAKQEIISGILEKAYQKIFTLDDEAYFDLMEKMLNKFCLPKTGEIYFSENDLKRMPADFEELIGKAAKENGGSLILSKESKSIDGGFILVYGGIEENCSIQAMFHTEHEFLADKVHEILF